MSGKWCARKVCTVAFETTVNMQAVAGIAAATGRHGAVAAPLATSFTLAMVAFSRCVGSNSDKYSTCRPCLATSHSIGRGGHGRRIYFALGSVVALIAMDIAIGVTAGVKTFEYEQAVADLNDLGNQITAVTNTPPDLTGMVNDTTGLVSSRLQTPSCRQRSTPTPSERWSTSPAQLRCPHTGWRQISNSNGERLDHLHHAELQRLEWETWSANLGRVVCPDLR